MAEDLQARCTSDVDLQDLLNHTSSLVSLLAMFTHDDLEAAEPSLARGAWLFQASEHPGIQAIGTHILLSIVIAHPAILTAMAERLQDALDRALLGQPSDAPAA